MRQRLLLLCPGQGNQHEAMFDMAGSDADGAALLGQFDVAGLMADPHGLYINRVAQPAIVASTLAMWAALRGALPAPALVAGYSIGELAAYGVAGALSPADALRLAAERAALMDASLLIHPGQALGAVGGIALANASAMLRARGYHIAIETAEDSCIAGGPAEAFAALEADAAAAGGRVRRLQVQVASHTPYLSSAVAPFAAALDATGFLPQSVPVLSGIAALKVQDKKTAVEHLSRQLAEPIRWMDCMDACAEAGITVALELGPGASLARMLQARHTQIACRSVADFRSLAGIRQWLARHFD